jgi:hypothetical protein
MMTTEYWIQRRPNRSTRWKKLGQAPDNLDAAKSLMTDLKLVDSGNPEGPGEFRIAVITTEYINEPYEQAG